MSYARVVAAILVPAQEWIWHLREENQENCSQVELNEVASLRHP